MLARSFFTLVAISLLTSAGCCCGPCGGGCCGQNGGAYAGGPFAGGDCGASCGPSCGPACGSCCGPIFPKPIRYQGSTDCEGCNSTFAWCQQHGTSAHWGGECGSCANNGSPCGGCGLFDFLRCRGTSCKGCGEVYYGQWVSDPPDCCDPCDGCNFTGPQGCCPGLLAQIAAGIKGCRTCGGACGCDSCSGGGYNTYDGGMMGSPGVLDQNWDLAPTPAPVPGKPIHKAEAPPQQRASVPTRSAPRVMRTASATRTTMR